MQPIVWHGFVVPSWSALARGVRPPQEDQRLRTRGTPERMAARGLVPHGTGFPSDAALLISLGQ